jgi:hypothetical protein
MNSYLKDLIQVLTIAGTLATLPLLAAFAGLQPPWPPAIAYVTAAFILMSALVMWEWVRGSRRAVRRRFILAGIALTILGIGAYLPLYWLFVEPIPGSSARVVRGTVCTPVAQRTYPDQCPDLSRDVLRGAEWEANLLWTRTSIMQVQLGLVTAWIAFAAGLVAFVGAVIAGRPTGTIARGPPPGHS